MRFEITTTKRLALVVVLATGCGATGVAQTGRQTEYVALPVVAELPVERPVADVSEAPAAQVPVPAVPIEPAPVPAGIVLLPGIEPAVPIESPADQPAPLVQAQATPRPLPPIRIPKPAVPEGPRRVGLQVGHWRNNELPDELRRIETQTGTSGGGVSEMQLNLDVANRVAAILRGHGYAVDILPSTVPPGYLADVFVSLHADGDPGGGSRGYKAAHGSRRGPYEDQLVRVLLEEYGKATGLPHDHDGVTRNMLGYYAFSWSRFQHSVAAHTPAAILELGFLTNAADRSVLLQRTDAVAAGVANGVLRFLDEVPAGAAFAEDLVVPAQQPRPTGTPQPAPSPAARTAR